MQIVYAKSALRVPMPNGTAVTFPPGQHFPADDPYVLAHPEQFSDDPRYHLAFTEAKGWYLDPSQDIPDVETATANPGEKRSVRRS